MADKLIPIPGSVPTNTQTLIGPADPNQQIQVTVKLRRKTEQGLPTLDEFLAGKRAFMTRQQLAERYGARPDDAAAVEHWATAQGLTVSGVDLARRQVHLGGTLAAMSRAFGVKVATYEHAQTKTRFRSPTDDIHIPETLAGIVTGVFGLNNMPVVVRAPVLARRRPAPARATAQATADPRQQFPGTFYPNEVARLYNFPSTQGAGQRVAILEFGGGFDPAVLADYFTNTIGLPAAPTTNAIFMLGTQMQLDDGATGEVYLDIEVVGAMAPKATMDVIFAPWTGQGYLNAIEQAIQHDDYAAISISYGLDEDAAGSRTNPGWPQLNKHVDEAFRDAAALGVPVFVSSGDQGSSCLRGQLTDGNEVTLFSPTAHAAYPATSPYATAVGGTMLYAENGQITREIVWNELGDLQQGKFYFGGATGGGVSFRYTKVPSYQTKAGINPQSVNPPFAHGRGIPDVAGNAGETTGYLVSQPPNADLPIAPVGGTSASAPMWAALVACVREALTAEFNGNVPKFFFNDFVYACGKTPAFRDIVGGRKVSFDPNQGLVPGAFTAVGDNRSTEVNGYAAQEGYDLCTGWGSPNGAELLKQLQAWLAAQPGS